MVGGLAALGSAFLWALSNILMGSQSGRVPAAVIAANRSLFATAFLMLISLVGLVTGASQAPGLISIAGLAGSGAVGMGAGDLLYIRSLRHIGVSRAFPISMSSFPLFTFAMAAVWLDEAITPAVLAGTALVLGGVVLVVIGGRRAAVSTEPRATERETARGVALVLAAGLLWALASIWLRLAAEGVDPAMAQAIRLPVATVLTTAIALRAGHSLAPLRYGRRSFVALLVTGIFGTAAGSMLYVVAVQEAGAARTAVLSSTAPLFALPMAAAFLRERITARIIGGTAVSIAGIWLVVAGP